jgi:hypothetical protein
MKRSHAQPWFRDARWADQLADMAAFAYRLPIDDARRFVELLGRTQLMCGERLYNGLSFLTGMLCTLAPGHAGAHYNSAGRVAWETQGVISKKTFEDGVNRYQELHDAGWFDQ